jgi:hypothetical protein
MQINISGIPKEKVLVALYNKAKALGMGVFQYIPGDMKEDDAKIILKETKSFDYLYGRVMKVNISGDSFDDWLYDRDNGEGAAKEAIESIL